MDVTWCECPFQLSTYHLGSEQYHAIEMIADAVTILLTKLVLTELVFEPCFLSAFSLS